MISGLYGSASNLNALAQQQEAIASNLAHMNTPGHRRLVVGFSEWLERESDNTFVPNIVTDVPNVDFSNGRMDRTERNLDWYLQGNAFFAYQGAEGIMYSKNGVVFHDSQTGQLVNGDGYPILDNENQPLIYNGPISKLTMGDDGSLFAGQQLVGKVGVFAFDNNQRLESRNQLYFLPGTATLQPPGEYRVMQGFRELSNANPTNELIGLIVGSRHFEATQKVIRTISEAIQNSIRS